MGASPMLALGNIEWAGAKDILSHGRTKRSPGGQGGKMNNKFRTARAYASARKQQKTAQRKFFWDNIGELTPSEWASAKLSMDKLSSEDPDFKIGVSNDSIKGRANLPRLDYKLGWLPNGHRYRLDAKKKPVSNIVPFQPRKDDDDLMNPEEFEQLLSTL